MEDPTPFTTETKHTLAPWVVGRLTESGKREITGPARNLAAQATLVADVHRVLNNLGGDGERDANAARIVAAVNACGPDGAVTLALKDAAAGFATIANHTRDEAAKALASANFRACKLALAKLREGGR